MILNRQFHSYVKNHHSSHLLIFACMNCTSEVIPNAITNTFTRYAASLYVEKAGLLSVFSQKKIGKQKPTVGLLVAPITVIASPMFGMTTAAKKLTNTRVKVHNRFSPRVI